MSQCPNCYATIAPSDVTCGRCGAKLGSSLQRSHDEGVVDPPAGTAPGPRGAPSASVADRIAGLLGAIAILTLIAVVAWFAVRLLVEWAQPTLAQHWRELFHRELSTWNWLYRAYDYIKLGPRQPAVAALAILAAASLPAVLPAASVWYFVIRKWTPRSRASYAFRFSMWPASVVGWPVCSLVVDILAWPGSYEGYERWHDRAIQSLWTGAEVAGVLMFFSFGIGNAIGRKKNYRIDTMNCNQRSGVGKGA